MDGWADEGGKIGAGAGSVEPATEPPILSPTVGRRWLAQEIRRLREAKKLKQSDLAKRLRCASTKIVHIETMRNSISGPDLEVLLPFLGVPDDRIPWYLQVWEGSKEKGWWDGNQAIPSWFSLYIGLEWGASEIKCWDMGYLTGLLQTRDYMESMLHFTGPADVVRSQVEARLRRQEALHRATHPLKVHAILDDAVLQRAIGGREVMRAQLRHLVALTESPNITIQVIGETGHRGHLGSFRWLGFPQKDDPGAIYVENQFGGLFLEKPEELATFRADFAALKGLALDPQDSAALIAKRAKDFR